MATNAQTDIRRAKEMRAAAKSVRDQGAKADFEAAAERLERRAAKKARTVGRKRRITRRRSTPVATVVR